MLGWFTKYNEKDLKRHNNTLRVQKYGNDGLKHGGKDVLWPMSLVTKGRFSLQPDLNLNTYGGKIFAISSSVYQTDKDSFRKTFYEF